MAKKTETKEGAQDQLWSQLEEGRVCMLWTTNTDQHPQPMTLFADKEAGLIWFITASDTDLAGSLTQRAPARMTFNAQGQDYQASLRGSLEVVKDDAQLDALWNIAVAAWFEGGRDDPKVRLLRFNPEEAAIWASDKSTVKVGLKLLNAGLRDGTSDPDVGVHHVIAFDKAA